MFYTNIQTFVMMHANNQGVKNELWGLSTMHQDLKWIYYQKNFDKAKEASISKHNHLCWGPLKSDLIALIHQSTSGLL